MLQSVTLITQYENPTAFFEQQRLLDKYAADFNTDHIIRLALLINQPPVADFNSAMQLLINLCEQNRDDRAMVIGAYISVTNTGSIAQPFKSYIINSLEKMSPDCQSACYFVLALEKLFNNDNDKTRLYLEKAITQKKDCVLAYCHLATLIPSRKEELLAIAKDNIIDLQSTKHIESLSGEIFLSPDLFIQECIFGTVMSEELFDFYLK